MYLTNDERAGVLLEAIEDAETQLNDTPESSLTLLRHVIATAKRHGDWPETDRKRKAEYQAKKAAENQAEPVPGVPVAVPEQVF